VFENFAVLPFNLNLKSLCLKFVMVGAIANNTVMNQLEPFGEFIVIGEGFGKHCWLFIA
jgi:hypothetical protein